MEVLESDLDGATAVDPTKLVVCLAGTGANGVEIGDDLDEQGLPVEMADLDTCVPILTLGEPAEPSTGWSDAIAVAVERRRGAAARRRSRRGLAGRGATVMQPREAYFAPRRATPLAEAEGMISAELIAPYPPGVPVLAPGELITREAVSSLLATVEYGGRIAYAADPSLSTIQTVLTDRRAGDRARRQCHGRATT